MVSDYFDPFSLFSGAYIGFSVLGGFLVRPCFSISLSLHFMGHLHKFCPIY